MTRALVACRVCYLLSVYDSANRDTRDDTFSLFTLAFGAFQKISNIFVYVEEIMIFLIGNCKIEQQCYIFFLFFALGVLLISISLGCFTEFCLKLLIFTSLLVPQISIHFYIYFAAQISTFLVVQEESSFLDFWDRTDDFFIHFLLTRHK